MLGRSAGSCCPLLSWSTLVQATTIAASMQPSSYCIRGRNESLPHPDTSNQASTRASGACGHHRAVRTFFDRNCINGPPLLALIVPYEESERGFKPELSDKPVSVTMNDGSIFTYKLCAALLKSPGHYCDAVLEDNTWLIQDGMVEGGRAQNAMNNRPSCPGFAPVAAIYCRV